MAAFVETLPNTGVFATRATLPLGTTTTTRSDVFGARERRRGISTGLGLEPRRMAIRLSIGEREIVLSYTHFGAGLPAWAPPVLRSLGERWGISQGWDGYNAKPTQVELVVRLLNHLSAVMGDQSPAPILIPLYDGGMQAEWHRNGQDLEIVVPADESSTYCYLNDDAEEDEEGELESNYARVQDLIARFR